MEVCEWGASLRLALGATLYQRYCYSSLSFTELLSEYTAPFLLDHVPGHFPPTLSVFPSYKCFFVFPSQNVPTFPFSVALIKKFSSQTSALENWKSEENLYIE